MIDHSSRSRHLLFLLGFLVFEMTSAKPPRRSPIIPSSEEVLRQQTPASWPDWIDAEMDQTLLHKHPHLQKKLSQSLSQAPSLLLEVSGDHLFGPDGIYPEKVNRETARSTVPVKVSYRPLAGNGFTIPCGIEMQGRSSLVLSPKRNFRLRFSKKFGPSSLKFPIFEAPGPQEFENLLIRNPTHDSWTVSWDAFRQNPRYVNDRWALETARKLGHLAPRQQWVHLYLNRIYWGVYALSERPDEHFAASHLGTKANDLDFFNADKLREGSEVSRRAAEAFLKDRFQDNSASFQRLNELVDLSSLIDHLLCQIYQGKTDWPHKNYFMVGQRGNTPHFRFGAWDSEIGFYEKPRGFVQKSPPALRYAPLSSRNFLGDPSGPGFWFRHLRKSREFRLIVADRFHHLSQSEGGLSPGRAATLYRSLLDEISPLLIAESLRWGDARREDAYVPFGPEWKSLTSSGSWLFTQFFPLRTIALKEHLRSENLWPQLEPPTSFNRIDQKGQTRSYLKNPNPKGIIIYTTDGSDPREPFTGKPRGKVFREFLALKSGDLVKSRILRGGKWSALQKFLIE